MPDSWSICQYAISRIGTNELGINSPSSERTHRIDVRHGRLAFLKATHKTWFMENSVGNVMNKLKIQGNKFEQELLCAKSAKNIVFIARHIACCILWTGYGYIQPTRTSSQRARDGQCLT